MMNTKTQTNFIAADTNSILRRHLPPALFETNARRLNRSLYNSFLMKKHSDTSQRGALKAVGTLHSLPFLSRLHSIVPQPPAKF